jgi:hypothetical protein
MTEKQITTWLSEICDEYLGIRGRQLAWIGEVQRLLLTSKAQRITRRARNRQCWGACRSEARV